jgi:hypothetical protein
MMKSEETIYNTFILNGGDYRNFVWFASWASSSARLSQCRSVVYGSDDQQCCTRFTAIQSMSARSMSPDMRIFGVGGISYSPMGAIFWLLANGMGWEKVINIGLMYDIWMQMLVEFHCSVWIFMPSVYEQLEAEGYNRMPLSIDLIETVPSCGETSHFDSCVLSIEVHLLS